MRVLMTADAVGGVWSYALQLAETLQMWGVEVALATQGPRPSPEQRAAVHRLHNVELFESEYRLEWMTDPWDDVADAGEWLLELARNWQPDVIHLNDYSHGSLPWPGPVIIVGHSCVFSWYQAVRDARPDASWDLYFERVRDGLSSAHLVVAPTQAMLDRLEHFYGPLPDSRVIHNGIDPQRFHPLIKERLVFVAGRLWDEAKNIGAVIDAAPQLLAPVAVAGLPHPEHPSTVPPGVNYLGRLSPYEISTWYGRASIYALPARYEPFGLTALEAGLCGCALVLGDIPSLREVWADAAWFIPPDDRTALAGAVNRLIGDDRLRECFRQRALQRARLFTAQRMAAAYMLAYQELIPARADTPLTYTGA